MLEIFAYKKYKKNKAEKEKAKQDESAVNATAASPSPSPKVGGTATPAQLLGDDDAQFLERLTTSSTDNYSDDDVGSRPPLPPRVKTPDLTWDSDSESFKPATASATSAAAKGKENKNVLNRLSLSIRRRKDGATSAAKQRFSSSSSNNNNQLAVPIPEVDRERDDLSRVLDDLNLAARNNKAFSLSADSSELVGKFTLVLKDLVNGVPTAGRDLAALVQDRDGAIAKQYEKLPKSLKKLVMQLPDKLTSSLAPELLAVAAEAQGVESKSDGGIKGAAKRLLHPKNLMDLVTKPGAVVSMLKGIMNALKLRWPAFIGTNVIWSVALFLLLFVLWYCHKRGREVRLDREKSDADLATGTIDGASRIEELPDDPALPAPPSGTPAIFTTPASPEPAAVASPKLAKAGKK